MMDIVESVSALQWLLQIFNLSQLEVQRKKWTLTPSRLLLAYTYAVILVSLVVLVHGLFEKDINQSNNSEIGDTVDHMQLIGIRVAHLFSIIEAFACRKEQQRLFEKIRQIDRLFHNSLNVDIGNREFRLKTHARGLAMFLLYIGSELFILAILLGVLNQSFMWYWIFYLVPLHICGLRYFQIFTTIHAIKRRFDKLTAILAVVNLVYGTTTSMQKFNTTIAIPPARVPAIKIISNGVPSLNDHRKFNAVNPELKKLLIIRDLYNRLWELTTLVNRCYGLSMLLNVGNDFLSITSNCYWIFLSFQLQESTYSDIFRIVASAVWSVPHLFNVVVLASLCHRTVQSTTGIALRLHQIEIDVLNENHNTVIEQFSLQLLHQKVTFTAFGFFNVDCTMLYTIVGATTTYLIILIQFHMNEQNPLQRDIGNA